MNIKPNQVVYTNQAKCKDCYRCVRNCPVKAIKMEDGQAFIVPDLCITCGGCVLKCPQHAKTYRKDIEKVMNFLENGTRLAISIAPSFAAIYSEWEYKRLPSALRLAGFEYVGETAIGAYESALQSKAHIEKEPDKSHICTACPAVVNYIEKYANSFAKYLVPVVSPMIAHAKMLKKKYDHQLKVVFVGPCIAKKDEADKKMFAGLVDAVLTFDELSLIFSRKNIEISKCEESAFDEIPGVNSQLFPLEGGLLRTAGLQTDTLSAEVIAISGFEELSDLLKAIQHKTKPVIIEPLFCRSGCINGPIMPRDKSNFEQKRDIIKYTENQNSTNTSRQLTANELYTGFRLGLAVPPTHFTEQQIQEVLRKTQKTRPEDELNCTLCGYPTCRDKAEAVLQGMAEVEMCIPYMKRVAEEKHDLIIQTSPNGIVTLNDKLEIIGMNPSFKKMFCCSDALLGKKISYLIDPDSFEKLLTGIESEIRKIVRYPSYNIICHQICYSIPDENQYIGIFIDVTDFETNKEKLNDLKTETIIQAQELIDHQVRMAQEMARFLGDSTAKGEMLLNNLINAIKK